MIGSGERVIRYKAQFAVRRNQSDKMRKSRGKRKYTRLRQYIVAHIYLPCSVRYLFYIRVRKVYIIAICNVSFARTFFGAVEITQFFIITKRTLADSVT